MGLHLPVQPHTDVKEVRFYRSTVLRGEIGRQSETNPLLAGAENGEEIFLAGAEQYV